jgi:hypothetical protein
MVSTVSSISMTNPIWAQKLCEQSPNGYTETRVAQDKKIPRTDIHSIPEKISLFP